MQSIAIKFAKVLLLLMVLVLAFALSLEGASVIGRHPFETLIAEFSKGKSLPKPLFQLGYSGDAKPIDLERYGRYLNVGTKKFYYEVTDMESLRNVMPEGIYPNQRSVFKNPSYQSMKQKGLLQQNHWKVLESDNLQAAYFVWAAATESEGVKAFFAATILEKAGHIWPAIQAYQAVFTFFPKAVVYSRDGSFVWYPAETAMASIKRLCRDYPDLGCYYQGGDVVIENGDDTNLANDVFKVTPGRFVKKSRTGFDEILKRFRQKKIVEKRGSGKVQLVRYKSGDWQMRVDGKPFEIRGITYAPTQIGLGPSSDPHAFSYRWMFQDLNNNGKIDAAYDAWVDKNKNDIQDKNEPALGDFQLLREMGCNTIRMHHMPSQDNYYDPKNINKALLRELYDKFGIRVLMGDFLGAYTIGSGATWQEGTDYTDPIQREKMKRIVHDMVKDLKEESFILMWVLGNENNMNSKNSGVNATRTNASAHPEAYASFLNEVAEMIHKIDPDHPVAVGNLETLLLDIYSRLAPAIDILAINSYRGSDGFGSLWQNAKRLFDRPVLIYEYGCDAYREGQGPNEDDQQVYLEGALRDIVLNEAGGPGIGNSIGGCIFEYLDEWWKDTQSGDSEESHQIKPSAYMPFPDGYTHEEWLGIMGQGSGNHSPFERQPRKAYDYFKKMWTKK